MVTIERKKLEQVLEALEYASSLIEKVNFDFSQEIFDIKEALAQPEQEPVGRFAKFTDGIWREVTDGSAGQPLYTAPPKRPWVGLTDEEASWCQAPSTIQTWKRIEATLKEKNT